MATRAGADALQIEAGEIAVGKLADLTLVDLRRFHLQPATPGTVVTNLVHAARGSDVHTVVVGGEIAVAGGRLARIDEQATLRFMRDAATRLTSA
jgi:5-methylthioadenosine/S-adenosylhomocysteine deaminase